MPTYYVEDYEGERNEDAVEPVVLSPVVSDTRAKVVEAAEAPKQAEKTARAQTKKK